MKKKLNFPQVLFASFFIATILTFANQMIAWENKIYSGIFAFIITLAVFSISEKIFKD
ncbi:hypothetical protein [Mesobacillus jeotgali]|uniref:hypothetical protein n=1 Tax=Mesobacillus jeotgali TaxID=129985 RepID=UPI00177F4389|nr:hypothetical protein [Mesobacillus jeotgali]UYZ20267.1 hypothetical protein FOF60_14380 [Mesobacillus jeotgali]